MSSKVVNFLKQLPWLALFWGIIILFSFFWGSIWEQIANSFSLTEQNIGNEFSDNLSEILYYVIIILPLVAISYINSRLNGFSLLFLFLLPLVNYYRGLLGIWMYVQFMLAPTNSMTFEYPIEGWVSLTFQHFNHLILIALGGALLAQHHRDRKLQQKEVLARD